MNVKKQIRTIIAEHIVELQNCKHGCLSSDRKIYLTETDYIRVHPFADCFEIGLHTDNCPVCTLASQGTLDDLDNVWRKFRYSMKKHIAYEEDHNDSAYAQKLKELYTLL